MASLVIPLVAAVFWARSYRADHGRGPLVFRTDRGWYSVWSERGRLTLRAPAPRGPPAVETQARQLVERLQNDDVLWLGTFARSDAETVRMDVMPITPQRIFRLGSPVRDLQQLTPAGAQRRALLAALDDPARFAAAHVLLTGTEVRRFTILVRADPRSNQARVDYNGLGVVLSINGGISYGDMPNWLAFWPKTVRIDPGQIPRLQEYWHRRLDAPAVSVPYWMVVAAGSVLPGAWVVRRWREVRRRRRDLCRRCGYDLRASGSQCPECGEPIECVATDAMAPRPSN